ncbi:uncharacterized protein TRIADDRAFT_26227, partial [Trichoplax adhaerens]
LENVRSLLQRFNIFVGENDSEAEQPQQLLSEVTFEGIVKYMLSDKCKNIIVMAGAGISTSAGIPDFRTPGTGLYDNLQKYDLPDPESIFRLSYFRENPSPFYSLAKELYPGRYKPTLSHYFIKLLHDKGLLLRHFTQNIDTLEHLANVPKEKLIEAHGSFSAAHCINHDCQKEYSSDWVKERVLQDIIPLCSNCNSPVKPDIVFFGESLPTKFFVATHEDFPQCDLLIIMGTSLKVQPFASLIERVPDATPRLLINLEKCGTRPKLFGALGINEGLSFDCESNYRDVFWQGTCDDGCFTLAEALGWKEELLQLKERGHKILIEKYPQMVTKEAKVSLISSAPEQHSQAVESKSNADGNKESTEDEGSQNFDAIAVTQEHQIN